MSDICIKIDGVVVAQDVDHDTWLDLFLEWVESNNWQFGGTTEDITERENNDPL